MKINIVKSKLKLVGLVMVFALLLSSCGGVQAAPTATPLPTSTSRPTETPDPTKTPTLEPTATLEPAPTEEPVEEMPVQTEGSGLGLSGRQYNIEGGYTFRLPLIDYGFSTRGSTNTISREDEEILISLGTSMAPEVFPLEDALLSFYESAEADFDTLERGAPYEVMIDGGEALAIDVIGIFMGDNVLGRIVVANPHDTLYLFAFSIATTYAEVNHWADEGAETFDNVLSSIQFLPVELLEGACEISTDQTYGYEETNPIKVGISNEVDPLDIFAQMDGVIRQRVYLETLLGPGGETISYERQGSISGEDAILDIYHVTYPGLDQAIILYVDIYHFEYPQAPVGFTCERPFPLE
ncbi:MAG: hypothetical protein JXB38_15805 [Anaerolineales bacterium]|nr:hypothetical protein [Anaerolineales bacterium]